MKKYFFLGLLIFTFFCTYKASILPKESSQLTNVTNTFEEMAIKLTKLRSILNTSKEGQIIIENYESQTALKDLNKLEEKIALFSNEYSKSEKSIEESLASPFIYFMVLSFLLCVYGVYSFLPNFWSLEQKIWETQEAPNFNQTVPERNLVDEKLGEFEDSTSSPEPEIVENREDAPVFGPMPLEDNDSTENAVTENKEEATWEMPSIPEKNVGIDESFTEAYVPEESTQEERVAIFLKHENSIKEFIENSLINESSNAITIEEVESSDIETFTFNVKNSNSEKIDINYEAIPEFVLNYFEGRFDPTVEISRDVATSELKFTMRVEDILENGVGVNADSF